MKRTLAAFIFILILYFVFLVDKTHLSLGTAENGRENDANVSTRMQAAAPQKTSAKVTVSPERNQGSDAPVQILQTPLGIKNEEEFRAVLLETNTNSYVSLLNSAERMKASDAKHISDYFRQALADAKIRSRDDVYRVIVVANAFHADEMVFFWDDVLKNNSDAEKKPYKADDHSVEEKDAYRDLTLSIMNLRRIAATQMDAVRVLSEYIKNAPTARYANSIRLNAFAALQSADKVAAVKVLKELDAGDKLLALVQAESGKDTKD